MNLKMWWLKRSIMWTGKMYFGESRNLVLIHRGKINYAIKVGKLGWWVHWWTPTKYFLTQDESDKTKPSPLGRYILIGLGWIAFYRGY
jgi:hypothetical protein